MVNWKKRFCNAYHNVSRLLDRIDEDHRIDEEYQDRTGLQPPVRTMQPIPHICAVVKYFIQWRSDNQGGINITKPIPENWHQVEPEVVKYLLTCNLSKTISLFF